MKLWKLHDVNENAISGCQLSACDHSLRLLNADCQTPFRHIWTNSDVALSKEIQVLAYTAASSANCDSVILTWDCQDCQLAHPFINISFEFQFFLYHINSCHTTHLNSHPHPVSHTTEEGSSELPKRLVYSKLWLVNSVELPPHLT